MKIETKLNISDDAYFITLNKVWQSTIERIVINVDGMGNYRTTYWVLKNPAGSQYTTAFDESEIFHTKEQLLATL